jgi:hypothetical protein
MFFLYVLISEICNILTFLLLSSGNINGCSFFLFVSNLCFICVSPKSRQLQGAESLSRTYNSRPTAVEGPHLLWNPNFITMPCFIFRNMLS